MKLGLRGIIGIALSAVLLWWTLRDVSLAVVWTELRRSNGWLFFWATLFSTIIFPLRARRWQTILEPVAPNQPFGALWKATAVGMMANNVLPARAGEIVRAYALTHQTKVPLSTSIASLAVDRLFDMLVLLLLAVVAFLDPAFPRSAQIAGQTIGSLAQGS
ncbi:MAG: lysylphosphatidylglycerol synthase transmembrane domain-containing protein, partial [Gemmatimonadaceae bacterium]